MVSKISGINIIKEIKKDVGDFEFLYFIVFFFKNMDKIFNQKYDFNLS